MRIEDLPPAISEKIRPNAATGCWEWVASVNDQGYGRFGWQGRNQRAHRVVYQLLKGDIPRGLQLDHLCRFTGCVNPDHLEPVTQAENNRRSSRHQHPKTHCPSGHEYTEANTKVYRGNRYCRACRGGKRSSERSGTRRRPIGGDR